MGSLKSKMNVSILTVFLAAGERLYARDRTAPIRVAALMERLAKDPDVYATMDRLENYLFGGVIEADEIRALGKSLGL